MRAAAVRGAGGGAVAGQIGLSPQAASGCRSGRESANAARSRQAASTRRMSGKRCEVAIVATGIVDLRHEAQVGQCHRIAVGVGAGKTAETAFQRAETLGDPVALPCGQLALFDPEAMLQMLQHAQVRQWLDVPSTTFNGRVPHRGRQGRSPRPGRGLPREAAVHRRPGRQGRRPPLRDREAPIPRRPWRRPRATCSAPRRRCRMPSCSSRALRAGQEPEHPAVRGRPAGRARRRAGQLAGAGAA